MVKDTNIQPKEKLHWRGVEREGERERERGSVGPYSDRRKVASQIPLQLPKGPGFLKSGAFLWGTYDQDYRILGHIWACCFRNSLGRFQNPAWQKTYLLASASL